MTVRQEISLALTNIGCYIEPSKRKSLAYDRLEAVVDKQIAQELIEELRAVKTCMNQDKWPKQPRLVDWVETRIKELQTHLTA